MEGSTSKTGAADVVDRVEETAREHEAHGSAEEHLAAAAEARLIGGTQEPEETADSGRDAVEVAAKSPGHARNLSDEAKMDALEWLLTDTDEDDSPVTQKWQFNVGTEDVPIWIDWVIRPIDADTMTALREQARGANRQQRRAARETDIDVSLFNLRMVATATVEPDLRVAAERKGVVSADPLYGAVELLKHKFRGKPGIVDQIASKVMLLSGYDEDDLRRATPETTMVRAAGNS
jgi:hypothetical protein